MTGLTAPSDVGASAVGASAQTPLCVGERNAEQKPAKRTPSWLFLGRKSNLGAKAARNPSILQVFAVLVHRCGIANTRKSLLFRPTPVPLLGIGRRSKSWLTSRASERRSATARARRRGATRSARAGISSISRLGPGRSGSGLCVIRRRGRRGRPPSPTYAPPG